MTLTEHLEALAALAKKATPGKRELCGSKLRASADGISICIAELVQEPIEADGEFMASLDREVAQALIRVALVAQLSFHKGHHYQVDKALTALQEAFNQ